MSTLSTEYTTTIERYLSDLYGVKAYTADLLVEFTNNMNNATAVSGGLSDTYAYAYLSNGDSFTAQGYGFTSRYFTMTSFQYATRNGISFSATGDGITFDNQLGSTTTGSFSQIIVNDNRPGINATYAFNGSFVGDTATITSYNIALPGFSAQAYGNLSIDANNQISGTITDITLTNNGETTVFSNLNANYSENLSLLGHALWGDDIITGTDSDDVLQGYGGNDILLGGAGQDTAVYDMKQSEIGFIRKAKTGGVIVLSEEGADTLLDIETIMFQDSIVNVDALISQKEKPTFSVHTQGNLTPEVYTGSVSYIEYQMYADDEGNIIAGSFGNDFINVLGGDDAVNAGFGDDIIDGGTGSNFLTGGGDNDTFFIDGRGTETQNTWSTITDFSNDEVNIWGWESGTSRLLYKEESNGAEGYKGATYHYDLNNDGNINTAITFSGMSINDVETSLSFQEGIVEGNGYLFIG